MTIKALRTLRARMWDLYEKIDKLNDLNKKTFYSISLTARNAMLNVEDHKFEEISIDRRLTKIKDRLKQINSYKKEVEDLDKEYSALAHKNR